ncbi:Legume-like lectin family/Bacterial lectin/Legume lectin domain containing protein, putative [Angomonas deanei]|uniref:Legume-like lectin family/Bacterial lectin/Legume lectin domain containing protein, putative n=1 Tax=Angomonas deanei TaxID=59799 RepID=A0A7G2CKV8_9TRYP|nr:Legume-like lectin family/Bacterial lectin/Legume lectin domain containing protein, putative [Angomonas deanei]
MRGTTYLLLALLTVLCSYGAASIPLPFTSFMTQAQIDRVRTTAIDHHSFSPPLLEDYYGGDGDIPFWSMRGNTVITDNYVRLTPDTANMAGQLWNTQQLDLHAFEIRMGFRIYHDLSQMKRASLHGDGLVLWLLYSIPSQTGPIYGLPNDFDGIGIVFDTYDNDNDRKNPKIGLITNSPKTPKVLSPQLDFAPDMMAHCVHDIFTGSSMKLTTVLVRYNGGQLEVFIGTNNNEASPKLCFRAPVDLQLDRRPAYIGVSAATGSVSAVQEIVFLHTSPVDGQHYEKDVHKPHPPKPTPPPAQQQGNTEEEAKKKLEKLQAELEQLKKATGTSSSTTTTTKRPTPPPTTKKPTPPPTKKPTPPPPPPQEEEDEEEEDDEEEEEEETTTTTKAPRRRVKKAKTAKKKQQ